MEVRYCFACTASILPAERVCCLHRCPPHSPGCMAQLFKAALVCISSQAQALVACHLSNHTIVLSFLRGLLLPQEFARVAMLKMPEFSPQNISNFCWAFARLGVRNEHLFAEGESGAAPCLMSAPAHTHMLEAHCPWGTPCCCRPDAPS